MTAVQGPLLHRTEDGLGRPLGAPQLIERLEPVVGAPVELTELKRKPGRRRTLRAAGPGGSAIVKLYVSERAPVVAERISSLIAGPPEPEVPLVLLLEPDLRMVVLSDVRGAPLRSALIEGNAAACRRAGAALSAWHGFWRGRPPDVLQPHTPASELATLEARAAAAPASIRAAVHSALPTLSRRWTCSTVVHRDLYEEQIFVGDRVGLIDLDDASLGPPELDIGNLLGHVDLLGLRCGADLAGVEEALLAGYEAAGSALDRDLLARCRRLTLLRLACIHGVPALLELEAG